MQDRFDVVVVGAGAAGLAALAALRRAGLSAVALEARARIGGRAHTVVRDGLPFDLGCGWLHSADVNPLVPAFRRLGFTVDETPPHWTRQSGNQDFSAADQAAFGRAYAAFEQTLEAAARAGVDRPASELMPPGGRWNHLLDAISSYYNGAEYDQVSVLDYAAYEDTGVNCRVAEGYGAALVALGGGEGVVSDCEVTAIDHGGADVAVVTSRGVLAARAVVVTLPTPLLAEERVRFTPALPEKMAAAAGLPLGLANKLMLRLAEPDGLPVEGHLFGSPERAETGSYHLRPFGRPYIEVYLGGRCARTLEGEGPGAAAAFCLEELTALLGADFRAKVSPLAETRWGADPFAQGSYSHAAPGHAGARAVLAAPVDGRLFFAGEATHPTAFSTCHGAWLSGERAAAEVLAALVPSPPREL